MKPSPNDRCPCGSGKKYKRCCLASDEASARAADPASGRSLPGGGMDVARAEVLTAIRETFGGASVADTMRRAIEHLAGLMERGGVLESWRFDRKLFAEIVTRRVTELDRRGLALDTDEGFEALFDHCIDPLVTPAFIQSSRATLDAALERTNRAEDTVAMAVALASLDSHLTGGREAITQSPVLRSIFGVQVDELYADRHEFGEFLRGLGRKGLSAKELEKLLKEKGDRLTAQLQAAPELQRALEKELDVAVPKALESLRKNQAPPFLTSDEMLWMLAQVAEVFAALPSAASQSRPTEEEKDSALRELTKRFEVSRLGGTVSERLMEMIPKASKKQRKTLQNLLMAISAEPGPVIIEAARSRMKTLVREGEAATLAACFESHWQSAPAVEAHLNALEAMGKKDAAERIRTALSQLARIDENRLAG